MPIAWNRLTRYKLLIDNIVRAYKKDVDHLDGEHCCVHVWLIIVYMQYFYIILGATMYVSFPHCLYYRLWEARVWEDRDCTSLRQGMGGGGCSFFQQP